MRIAAYALALSMCFFAASASAADCVNINAASLAELERISHIGPTRAQELVQKRPCASIDDLVRITGIGPARLADFEALLKRVAAPEAALTRTRVPAPTPTPESAPPSTPDPAPLPTPDRVPEPTPTPNLQPTPEPVPAPAPLPVIACAYTESHTERVSVSDEEQPVLQRTITQAPANGGQACPEPLNVTASRAIVPPPPPAVAVAPGNNGYYEALLPRAWKAYSLRTQAQIDGFKAGSRASFVTYDPAMDAARVVIPEFDPVPRMALAAAIGATDTTLTFTAKHGGLNLLSALKVDDEVMVISTANTTSSGASTIVLRGQGGTVAAAHAAGSRVYNSTNSLLNVLYLPLGTSDGHRYLVTFDLRFADSMIAARTGLSNYKTVRFENNGAWLQLDTRFSGNSGSSDKTPGFDPTRHVGVVGARSVNVVGGGADWTQTDGNHLGPGMTANSQMAPQPGQFILRPNVWVRYWVEIEQRANDYDLFSLWVADEAHEAVRIFDRVPVSVRPRGTSKGAIDKLMIEFNTSTNALRIGRGDLVAYMRNVAVLQDADAAPLLVKPTAQ